MRTALAARGAMRAGLGAGAGVRNGLLNALVAYWALGEASGNREDSHITNRDMLPINTPSNRTGKLGNALDVAVVNGEGKYCYYDDLANNLACPSGSSITVCGWIYIDAFGSVQSYLVSRWGGTGDWALIVRTNGSAGFEVETGATDTVIVTEGGQVSIGAWAFVAGWYDHTVGANGTIYVQVNNGTVFSKALTTAKGSSSRYVSIGELGHTDAAYGTTDGAIDEVGIWKSALTADQRAALWNLGNGLAYSQFTT